MSRGRGSVLLTGSPSRGCGHAGLLNDDVRRLWVVARDGVADAGIDQCRLLLGASIGCLPAPCAEPAAGRRIGRLGSSPESTMRRRACSTQSGRGSARPTAAPACTDAAACSYTSVGGARLDDLAEVHDRDPVADVAHDGEVVGDEHERQIELGAESIEELDDLGLDADVERRHRFVEHEQVGGDRECSGDADALALPAGELVRIAVAAPGATARCRAARRHAAERSCPRSRSPCTSSGSDSSSRTVMRGLQRRLRILEHHLEPAPQPGAVLAAPAAADRPRRTRSSRSLAR